MPKVMLNARIEKETRDNASEILSKLGLNMTTAIDMYLRQIVVDKQLPFVPRLEDKKEESEPDFKWVDDLLEKGGLR